MAIHFDEVTASAPAANRGSGADASSAPSPSDSLNFRKIERDLRRLQSRQSRLNAT